MTFKIRGAETHRTEKIQDILTAHSEGETIYLEVSHR